MMDEISAVLEGKSRWAVVHGDCLEVLPTLPDGCAEHVITDPPYSERTHFRLGREGRSDGHSKRKALPFGALNGTDTVAAELARLPLRWVIVFGDEYTIPEWMAFGSAAGLEVVRHGVWVKSNPMPQMSGDRPGVGFESMVIMHAPRISGRMRWNGGGRCAVFRVDGSNPRGSGEEVEHPTRKPLPLMLELVELFTDPGELVIDPFAGSGTTGVACLRLGRRFLGIEKNADYHRIAVDRLTAESQGQNLREFRAGQLPMFAEAKWPSKR